MKWLPREKRNPFIIVVLFYGNPPDEVTAFAKWPETPKPGTTDGLIDWIRRWYEWVEKRDAA